MLPAYEVGTSTGPLQAVNHKITLLHRMVIDYRDREFLGPRILRLHKATSPFTHEPNI